MLPLPNLNEQDFETIAANAISIAGVDPRIWNDTDAHDPGVTLLDLFSFLKFTQQNYLDGIGSKSLIKSLSLLHTRPRPATPAQTVCCFQCETDTEIPCGAKLLAGDTVFETTENVFIATDTLEALSVVQNGLLQTAYPLIGDRPIHLFGIPPCEGVSFLLRFGRPLTAGKKISFYFDMSEPPVARNPIADSDSFIELATLQWEYYGLKEGIEGWHTLTVNDKTHALLFSGFISFTIEGTHTSCVLFEREAYYLRCTLLQNGYDNVPTLNNIRFNSTTVVQQDTTCETISFTVRQILQEGMLFKSALYSERGHTLLVRQNNRWAEASTLKMIYTVQKSENMDFTLQIENIHSLQTQFAEWPPDEPVLRLILRSGVFAIQPYLGESNGSAHQVFMVPQANALPEAFSLMTGEKGTDGVLYFDDWQQVTDFNSSAPDDCVYILNPETGALQFGDNERGKAPLPGPIMPVAFASTRGTDGNTQAGQITHFKDEAWRHVQVVQPGNAVGGTHAETLESAITRARADINAITRAVTVEDYEAIAQHTPGLCLTQVTALPLYKPGLNNYPETTAPNCVTVVFEQATDNRESLTLYAKNILNHLEKHKLITTQLYVVPPRLLGLEIYGEVIVNAQYNNAAQIIHDALANFIEKKQSEQLGQIVYFGDVYGAVDALACIESIRYIKLELAGEVAPRNKMGDLLLPPNGRVYLKGIYLNIT